MFTAMMRQVFLSIVVVFMLMACAADRPEPGPSVRPYEPVGTPLPMDIDPFPPVPRQGAEYVNSDGTAIKKTFSDLMKWYVQRAIDGLPKPPSTYVQGYNFPVLRPDLTFLNANTTVNTVTWIGHATTWVQMGGLNILTDPHFSERASPVQWAGPARKVSVPVQISELPRIDVVVISHNHFDHLDEGSIRQINQRSQGRTLFLVPSGLDETFRQWGIENVQAMGWWTYVNVRGVRFYAVPVNHWSARTGFDRNNTLWAGWMIRSADFSFYFGGDTGYSADFAQVGKRFGQVDVAAIPVGAYEPRWFLKEQHVNPAEAVQIHKDLNARYSIGIHWGTFELTDEPLDAPIGDVKKAAENAGLADGTFMLLKHGQTQRF